MQNLRMLICVSYLIPILLTVAHRGNAVRNCSAVTDSEKIECGYHGINRRWCLQRGCDWCKSDIKNVPWCFYVLKQAYNCSNFTNVVKKDCHSDRNPIKRRCETRGCFWCESKVSGEPWCFYPPTVSKGDACSPVPTNDRLECGYIGINESQCLRKGCNWCRTYTTPPTPWCFTKRGGDECSEVANNKKIDCGHFGITEDECKKKSCVWCPTDAAKVPWCYKVAKTTK